MAPGGCWACRRSSRRPDVLRGARPALRRLASSSSHGWPAFIVLGAVVLAVTGAEALYADMGHFGRPPIRIAWFALVLPALLLNYFGQGALLLRRSGRGARIRSTCWPRAGRLYPLVVLATWRHGDRVAGADLGRVLAHAAGGPARLPAAARRCATPRRRRGPDLRARESTGCCSAAWSCWCSAFSPRATWPRPTASR